jgi:glutathione S-transferase
MPMLTLWTNSRSSNGQKVSFLLGELGLTFEERVVSLAHPRPAEYLALNPVGGLPLLQDDHFVLAESQAILRYLATRAGRDDLYPADPRDRARVDEFLDRFATGLRTQLFRRELVMLGWTAARGFCADDADPAAAPAIEAEIHPAVTLLEGLVGERGAVLDRFTIADCALAPVLARARDTGLDLSPYPRLTALAERLLARPAWAALYAAGAR